jgi:phosphoglycolate phosphatase-like HAD superfamily hydrolase
MNVSSKFCDSSVPIFSQRSSQMLKFLKSSQKTTGDFSDQSPLLEIKCGVLSLFAGLKRMGKKIATFTTGSRHFRVWMLQELGLWDVANFLETSNGISDFPRLFEDAFKHFNNSGIYIGCSLDDISTAQDQGVYCIHYSEAENAT